MSRVKDTEGQHKIIYLVGRRMRSKRNRKKYATITGFRKTKNGESVDLQLELSTGRKWYTINRVTVYWEFV